MPASVQPTCGLLSSSIVTDTVFIPVPVVYTGDNAAMIGAAGYWNYKQNIFADLDLNTDPGLDFELLQS